jgi:hypothetical protein
MGVGFFPLGEVFFTLPNVMDRVIPIAQALRLGAKVTWASLDTARDYVETRPGL